MPLTASGHFEVKIAPQSDEDFPAGRMTIDKTYQGDLTGSGKGQMLSARSAVKGSAGYVAIETVSGTLNGRSGTFVLQHSGQMNRGEPSLSVSIIPDSGTGELEGISGSMTIDQSSGKHAYVLSYRFADK